MFSSSGGLYPSSLDEALVFAELVRDWGLQPRELPRELAFLEQMLEVAGGGGTSRPTAVGVARRLWSVAHSFCYLLSMARRFGYERLEQLEGLVGEEDDGGAGRAGVAGGEGRKSVVVAVRALRTPGFKDHVALALARAYLPLASEGLPTVNLNIDPNPSAIPKRDHLTTPSLLFYILVLFDMAATRLGVEPGAAQVATRPRFFQSADRERQLQEAERGPAKGEESLAPRSEAAGEEEADGGLAPLPFKGDFASFEPESLVQKFSLVLSYMEARFKSHTFSSKKSFSEFYELVYHKDFPRCLECLQTLLACVMEKKGRLITGPRPPSMEHVIYMLEPLSRWYVYLWHALLLWPRDRVRAAGPSGALESRLASGVSESVHVKRLWACLFPFIRIEQDSKAMENYREFLYAKHLVGYSKIAYRIAFGQSEDALDNSIIAQLFVHPREHYKKIRQESNIPSLRSCFFFHHTEFGEHCPTEIKKDMQNPRVRSSENLEIVHMCIISNAYTYYTNKSLFFPEGPVLLPTHQKKFVECLLRHNTRGCSTPFTGPGARTHSVIPAVRPAQPSEPPALIVKTGKNWMLVPHPARKDLAAETFCALQTEFPGAWVFYLHACLLLNKGYLLGASKYSITSSPFKSIFSGAC